MEAAVPHETWAKISPTGHEGGLLCVTCMAKRAAKLGLTGIPAKVWSGPFVFEMGDPRPDRSAEEKAVDLVREWLASSDHPVSDWERSFAAAIITFATTIGSIAAQPCVHCNDTGWVDDENWWPDYPGSSQERVPGNGKIRCGMLCTADTKGESPHGDTD
ncbi:hypothetical protein NX02_22165 [Sphingomonas sanxanigenens DSM 19645 = NX02]|uniref:Uncharacterized protein n=1 Tax=Sphingomonas sanxanigenens DSM 19645 = NX02 TaxID=1123269 RepID=W0AIG1_9SPHN|nr:hypothetical protein NX02_22165 [Sphingomonas sanxanigenens DSM 19645 = NX02]